jgi:hypothetical protein
MKEKIITFTLVEPVTSFLVLCSVYEKHRTMLKDARDLCAPRFLPTLAKDPIATVETFYESIPKGYKAKVYFNKETGFSINTVAHEMTHVATTLLYELGVKSLPLHNLNSAPKDEEYLASFVGNLTKGFFDEYKRHEGLL